MFLIVGLGNPGKEYAGTRHNVGFMAVDIFAQKHGVTSEKTEKKALVCKLNIRGEQVLVAKPMTFMNLSGESVQALLAYYNIPVENLLVIHDDIDQPFESMRFHKNRGHGGHNGIRSISQLLGSQDYVRLKLGVGRPPNTKWEVADYVLSPFSKDEQKELEPFLDKSCLAIESFIFDGYVKAADFYNRKED